MNNTTPLQLINAIHASQSFCIGYNVIQRRCVLFIQYQFSLTTGTLNISVKGNIQELFLCDNSGKLLQRFDVNGDNKLELDISPYPIGTYRIMYFESTNVPRSGTVVLAK